MRCSSYCTADSYRMKELVSYLNESGLEPKHFDEVIYVQKEIKNNGSIIDVFFFPFGCSIIWGANEEEEKAILNLSAEFEINSLKAPSNEYIYYKFDPSIEKTFIDEERNEILIKENSVFVKLSMSHALAQSVKLSVLEISVSNLLQNTTPIQKELASTGSVSLSKKEISKQIGILFSERYSINLHSDILDTPEFFWRRPSYEPLYLATAQFQDIQIRHNILNHRLNMIHELYTLLSNELNYKHSTKLEWIIIILITMEVTLGISNHDIFTNFFLKLMH